MKRKSVGEYNNKIKKVNGDNWYILANYITIPLSFSARSISPNDNLLGSLRLEGYLLG